MNPLNAFILGVIVTLIYERKGWRSPIVKRWPFKLFVFLNILLALLVFFTHHPTP